MPITPLDEYPIHQAPTPLVTPMSGDSNAYDRFFFHGYRRDGSVVIGAAMGVYPNRQIIDAAVTVAVDGQQHSVFASGRAPLDRRETNIGPIRIEIVDPLRTLRVTCDAADEGVTADLVFEARTAVEEEDRQTIHQKGRLILDSSRLTQFGTWSGTVTVDGTTMELDRDDTFGTRDRSWGIRPMAADVPQAPNWELPQVFWVWTPIHLDARCLHAALMETPAGVRTQGSWLELPVLAEGDPTWGVEPERRGNDLDVDVAWRTDRRWPELVEMQFGDLPVTMKPIAPFALRGLGYSHPERGHGTWHDELSVARDTITFADLDPMDLTVNHVQHVCEVTAGDESGVGIVETISLGDHPSRGLAGFLDPPGA
ncbi:MAG: hypothetical protein R3249_03135 [Nitriliruptorales bacterium]|nr:hypothetical protein [Nitriliruptorales bacterium]